MVTTMPAPAETLARLRAVAERWQAGEPIDLADLAPLLAALADTFAGRADGLDAALGLATLQGSRSWRYLDALARRDDLLRRLHREHLPALSVNAAAERIATLALRYQSTAWMRDRSADELPARLRGRPEALLWQILKAAPDAAVPGARRLRQILGEVGNEQAVLIANPSRDDGREEEAA